MITMLISLLLAFTGGLITGAISSIFTGVNTPVLAILMANTGIVSTYPVPCLIFLITTTITNQLLTTVTSHKSAVPTIDGFPEVFSDSQFFTSENHHESKREYLTRVLELGQSLRHTLKAKINSFRLGYFFFGIPLIILSNFLPINTISTVIGSFSVLSVPLLCISIAVLSYKKPKLGLFICIGGALAWLVLNSPAMAGAPSSAPILLIFSCALITQNLRPKTNNIPMRWLSEKYCPKLSWYLGLLRPIDWLHAIAGGTLAGMSPGFVKALTEGGEQKRRDLIIGSQLSQIQVQGISEMLSLFLVLIVGGNARTSLSAEVYTILPEANIWVGVATIALIELIILLVNNNIDRFVMLVDKIKINPVTHTLLPNLVLLTFALGPLIALPGAFTSMVIGLLHKKLKLNSSEFITVLSLPTLLILSPLNAELVDLVF